jgi:hypothetical protein
LLRSVFKSWFITDVPSVLKSETTNVLVIQVSQVSLEIHLAAKFHSVNVPWEIFTIWENGVVSICIVSYRVAGRSSVKGKVSC